MVVDRRVLVWPLRNVCLGVAPGRLGWESFCGANKRRVNERMEVVYLLKYPGMEHEGVLAEGTSGEIEK